MPKYNVSVSFDLVTEVEPESIGFDSYGVDGVEDLSDDSYYRRTEVECDGGAVSFVVECADEDAARDAADQIVSEGNVLDDANGIGWEINNVSVEIEVIEIPMDLDRATTLVEAYLAQMEGMDDDLKEAFSFLMDTVVDQARRAVELASTITELRSEIDRLTPAVTDPATGIITTA